MKRKLQLKNLDCANCARKLEEEVAAVKGVKGASVDFMRQTLTLECESEAAFSAAVQKANTFEDVRVVEKSASRAESVWKEHKAEAITVLLSVVLLVGGIVLQEAFGQAGGVLAVYTMFGETYVLTPALLAAYVLFAGAYFAVGWKILWETCKNIAHGRIFDENFLMTLASVGALVLGQYAEAAEVMVLYCIGELLQGIAVGSSRRSIASLMDLKSETATVLVNGEQKIVAPEEIRKGDILLVKAGEKVAADGVIVRGETELDTKSLSGEAMLRAAGVGDIVLGGSINAGGVIEVRAEKDYSESTVAKILDLVENSSAKKAKSEKFITKFAKIYTPVVVCAALLVAFLAPVFTGNYAANLGDWVYRALTFLVISCPCALVISVPLSYFSGIGFAAKYGILVKGSTGLDALVKAQIAAFDKTGTLTYGNFTIGQVHGDRERTLAVAAAAEKNSSHPVAQAFAQLQTPLIVENAKEEAGRGVVCEIEGKTALAGNKKLLDEYGISAPDFGGGTLVYVALGGEYLGCAVIEDKIKENAREAISALRAQGIRACYMLTGDNKSRAEAVAAEVGLDGVYAGLLPDQKLEIAQQLKQQGSLLYAGDGINDAPVLVEADAGVSMGGVGSDAAIEASEVVLMRDDLSLLPLGRRIGKRTRSIVLQNIVFSILIKIAVMVLGVFDLIPLGIAVFADVGVMMLAVLNSFRTRIPFSKKQTKTTACNGSCGL